MSSIESNCPVTRSCDAVGRGFEEAGGADRVLFGQRLLHLLQRYAQRGRA